MRRWRCWFRPHEVSIHPAWLDIQPMVAMCVRCRCCVWVELTTRPAAYEYLYDNPPLGS